MDDDSGRTDVVGEVASFVHGEEIEAGIGAGSSSNCAKLGNRYPMWARKAIQGYFGPDSMQYAQAGGTRQTDRKTGGRRAKGRGPAHGGIRRPPLPSSPRDAASGATHDAPDPSM